MTDIILGLILGSLISCFGLGLLIALFDWIEGPR